MFGFVKTIEKEKFIDNNELRDERKRKERRFTISFIVFALALLNIALYLLTNSN
jgi:predicted nucleic acid-binding Zn ribbon protein